MTITILNLHIIMITVSCFVIFQGKIQGQIIFSAWVGAQIRQWVQQIFHESQ